MPVSISGTNGVTFPDSSLQAAAASPYVLKNRIINGDMRIDQRNAGASVTITTANEYTIDRWRGFVAQSSKYSVQQNAGSVTPPTGFTNYLGATSTSAYSVLTGDYFFLSQTIEGYNFSDFSYGTANAQTATLSFWVRSSLTGTFGGSLYRGGGVNKSYLFSYTISAANTWEQKSITITGDITSGLVSTTNGEGVQLRIGLGSGSTFSGGTVNTWQAGNFVQPTGSVSVVGTNGATFYITGVQLEQNTSATPFERRLYNQELANCQRYCLKYCGNTVFEDVNCNLIGFNTTTAYGTIFTVVPMRSSPSVTSGTLRLTDQTNVPTVTSVVASGSSYSGPYNINVGVNAASGVVQYRPYQLQANNSTAAYLILSAEL